MKQNDQDKLLWSDFREYFNAFVVNDIEKALVANIEVGVIVLTSVGIECLSGYYAGKKADKKTFVDFMHHFMPASYRDLSSDIYACIRNGLAHDYVVNISKETGRSFFLQRGLGEPHLTQSPGDPNIYYLNREAYARDFLEAQKLYFQQAETDQVTWNKAVKRLTHAKSFLTVKSETEVRKTKR